MINPTAQGNGPLKGHLEPAAAPLLSQPSVAFTQDPKFTSSAAGSSKPAVATLLSQSSAALTQ